MNSPFTRNLDKKRDRGQREDQELQAILLTDTYTSPSPLTVFRHYIYAEYRDQTGSYATVMLVHDTFVMIGAVCDRDIHIGQGLDSTEAPGRLLRGPAN